MNNKISAHRKVFQDKSAEEQQAAAAEAEKRGSELATQRHHGVVCPACGCVATVQGRAFGKERVSHGDGEIIVRQPVAPTSFDCSACELKLEGYAELEAAGLGGHYQRRTTYSPEEYYGLTAIDDLHSYLEDYFEPEYDNE